MKFYVGLVAGALTLVITVASVVAAFCGGIFVGYKLRESEEPNQRRYSPSSPRVNYRGMSDEPSTTTPEEPELP